MAPESLGVDTNMANLQYTEENETSLDLTQNPGSETDNKENVDPEMSVEMVM